MSTAGSKSTLASKLDSRPSRSSPGEETPERLGSCGSTCLRFDFFDISSQSLYNVHSVVELSRLSTHERKALDISVERLYAYCGDRVRLAVLFGSKARGNASPDCDVEVLVALTNDDPPLRSQVRRLAARVSLEYDLLLSIQAVGRSQWDKLAHYRFPFYQTIESEGIDLAPKTG